MREILFRGQTRRYGERVRIGDGKKLPSQWVYGGIFAGTGDFSVIYGAKTEEFTGAAIEKHTVYSDTIGQYTGLKDKNGKRIFDGDMIKPFDDEIDKMVVEFHNGQFLLCLYGERGYMAEYGWEEEGNYGCFEAEPLSSYGDDIEVIGNIHDNPELLEVQ